MNALKPFISLCLIVALSACVSSQPGKPGTPLPPPNKAVGKKWPPEVREFIDAMQTMFVDGKPAPSLEEIEKAFHVKVVVLDGYKQRGVWERAKLVNWPLGIQNDDWAAFFYNMFPENEEIFYVFTFDPDIKRYCIDPYDYAIYTGAKFSADLPQEHVEPQLPKAYFRTTYEWGMFERVPYARYKAMNLDLRLSKDHRCITSFRPNAFFKPTTEQLVEKKP